MKQNGSVEKCGTHNCPPQGNRDSRILLKGGDTVITREELEEFIDELVVRKE